MSNQNITKNEIKKCNTIINKLHNYYSKRIVGQTNLEKLILISLISNGHILLESVPGLAKTTAAKTFTEAINAKFGRIQCTPDLMPSDIIGTQIFNYKTNSFETKLGPIFANLILIDEINRSSSKTQSATLEAMQEKHITIDGVKYDLPEIFLVIATNNPIEEEGTYPLAESQLDRFLLNIKLNYPSISEEIEILNKIENNDFEKTESPLSLDDIKYLQNITNKVFIDETIKEYIATITNATRNPHNYLEEKYADYIELGASPRAAIAFLKCSKVLALLNNRTYVTPDDIKEIRHYILRHRIQLSFNALSDDITKEQIIDLIFESIQTP